MGTLSSSLMIGAVASIAALLVVPNKAITFSRSTSSRWLATVFTGLCSSSRTIRTIFFPSTPPLAFMLSMAISAPRRMDTPTNAAGPLKAAERPIRISSAAFEEPGNPTRAAQAANSAAVFIIDRFILFLLPSKSLSYFPHLRPTQGPGQGLLSPHGRAASKAAAALKMSVSRLTRLTSCMPMGRPSLENPHGTDAAGNPHRFTG